MSLWVRLSAWRDKVHLRLRLLKREILCVGIRLINVQLRVLSLLARFSRPLSITDVALKQRMLPLSLFKFLFPLRRVVLAQAVAHALRAGTRS